MEWSRIAWEETLASNTDVDFQVAVSNSADGPWTYRGPDSTSGTYFTTPAGETLPNDANFEGRYARFKARLSTSDGLNTPKFGNVHLTFGGTGLLASSCRNFVYDDAGNLTSIVTVTDAGSATDDRNPVAAPINNLNQIKRRVVGGATWNYTYDLDGNMTGKTDGTNTYTYTWSDENRLTRVQGPGGLDVRYTYDSIGRMLTRESGSDLTQFVWDGWDCVREVTGTDDTVYYIPNGLLQSFSLNGVVYQVHMDALSSLRMITDSSGTVVARVEYGAYGEEIFVSAIPALQKFPYRFVGALGVRTDAATGLHYMRQRWYDCTLQRFISRDPIGLEGGDNLYAYVANNPVGLSDPSGLAVPLPVPPVAPVAPAPPPPGPWWFPIVAAGAAILTWWLIKKLIEEAAKNRGPGPQPRPTPSPTGPPVPRRRERCPKGSVWECKARTTCQLIKEKCEGEKKYTHVRHELVDGWGRNLDPMEAGETAERAAEANCLGKSAPEGHYWRLNGDTGHTHVLKCQCVPVSSPVPQI